MDEQQRHGRLKLALLVDIVDIKNPKPVNVDVARELWELVDLRLVNFGPRT